MTEWVTIKIPEETRDTARETDATYDTIMQMGITAYQEGLVNTDGEVIGETPEPGEFGQIATVEDLEQLKDELSMANEPGVDAPMVEIQQALETQEEIIDTQEEVIGYMEQTIDEVQQQRDMLVQIIEAVGDGKVDSEEVAGKIEDLENRLPRKVAEELR